MHTPAFDYGQLLDTVGGDEDCVRELIDIFLEDAVIQIDGIRTAGDDFSALARVAHTLKGATGNMAAESTRRAAERLEMAAREGASDRVAQERVSLLAEMGRLVEELRATKEQRAAGELA